MKEEIKVKKLQFTTDHPQFGVEVDAFVLKEGVPSVIALGEDVDGFPARIIAKSTGNGRFSWGVLGEVKVIDNETVTDDRLGENSLFVVVDNPTSNLRVGISTWL